MPKANWYKGNLHTHTTESDGDADPRTVARWYRQHGYDFLVLSDHNLVTNLEYGSGRRRFRKPLVIPGEEVSVRIRNGTVPIHVNAIGITKLVEPIDAEGIVPTLQANVDATRQAGGIASINHPNYEWAFDHESIRQVNHVGLLEVYNGHPATNVHGGPGKFSYEEIWDGVLTAGRVIFGVATDDAHKYHDFGPKMGNPGRGWVMVRAVELSVEAIMDGLATGAFYSSTGVTLSTLDVSQDSIRLTVEQEPGLVYATRFTGKGGTILAEVSGGEAEYSLRGDEGYVRATVISSSGARAWVQPVMQS
jgi:hypothetical protein